MARLIDGDAIIIDLLDRGIEGVQTDDLAEFQQIVADAPTVDAVPVVRCRDCRYRDPEDHKCDCGKLERQGCPFPVDDDYFCKYGERKGGDGE